MAINTTGGVEDPRFAEWIIGLQRNKAQFMKQCCLLPEERASARMSEDEMDKKDGE